MKQVKRLFALSIAIVVIMALAGPVWAEETAKININTATVEELAELSR